MVLVSRMNTRISNEAGQWESLELKSIREKGMIIHQKAEKEQEPDPCKNKKKGWCYRSMCPLGWAFPQSYWVFAWRSQGTGRCWVSKRNGGGLPSWEIVCENGDTLPPRLSVLWSLSPWAFPEPSHIHSLQCNRTFHLPDQRNRAHIGPRFWAKIKQRGPCFLESTILVIATPSLKPLPYWRCSWQFIDVKLVQDESEQAKYTSYFFFHVMAKFCLGS